jgi:bisanhydrobacterioruberin hydratase
MERQGYLSKYGIIAFIYIIFGVGAAGHLIPALRPAMISMTPALLLGMGLLVLYFPMKENGKPIAYWIIGLYIVTFTLEAIGVATGIIFGAYSYGASLGFRIFDVPLIIGFNWVVVILGSLATSSLITRHPIFRIILTAVIAVVFDVVLEPVAIQLDYWQWEGDTIPFRNYAVWFVISLSAAGVFIASGLRTTDRKIIHYLIAQLSFFIVLALFLP